VAGDRASASACAPLSLTNAPRVLHFPPKPCLPAISFRLPRNISAGQAELDRHHFVTLEGLKYERIPRIRRFHPRSPGADENATPVAQFFATAAERESV